MVDEIRSWRSLANAGRLLDPRERGGTRNMRMNESCEGLPVTVDACSWGVVVDVDAMLIGSFKGVLL